MSENTRIALRQMAWQRAKGELMSCLETYFSEDSNEEKYDLFSHRIKEFIFDVEQNGLQE